MTTIITRAGKGSPLTNNEMDTNLTNLNNFKVEQTTATGAAVIPTGTTAQRPVSPVDGYIRYNTTLQAYEGYKNGNWLPLGGGATGGGTNDVFYENSTTVTSNYTITTNKNAMTAGPVTINNGVTVTIPNGSVWSVI